jgi:YidC/Oxa1 family membrane protein insertase
MNAVIPNFLFLSYPMINIIVVIYQVLIFLHIPSALGFSIIILTVLIRLILYPFTAAQIKASMKMQKIAPHLSKLKEKHKGDSMKIQQETMRLYKEHGINPAAGCLPILIQLPLIYALYQVLNDVVKYSTVQVNHVLYSFIPKLSRPWELTFFGLPLGARPQDFLPPSKILSMPSINHLILLIPVLTAVTQFILSKMMIPAKTGVAILEKDIEKKVEIDKKDANDFASAFQSQSLFIFPVMIGFFSFSFPIGLSLYWNTFTIFGIIQQYKITGLGGLKEWIKKK